MCSVKRSRIISVRCRMLISSLTKAGVNPDEIETLDRSAMLESWAKLVATGGDKVSVAGASVAAALPVTGYDVAFEREKLAFEKQKFEMQIRQHEAERAR